MQALSGLNSNGFNQGRKKRKIMSEINITPMVDVMLVLLIIFMVTSPMLVTGIEVNLPKANTSNLASGQLPLVVSINKQGEIFITDTKIEADLLLEKLINITQEKKDTEIFVKGDKELPYGTVIEIMSEIYNAGFTKVALISDPKRR